MYHSDHKEIFPYFTDPNASYSIVRCVINPKIIEMPFRGAHSGWNYALADQYYNGMYNSKSFYPPAYPLGLDAVGVGRTPYYYGCVFISDPEFWNPATRTDRSQLRSTALSKVFFPSLKTLLFSEYPYVLGIGDEIARAPMQITELSFVDGSVAIMKVDDIMPGYVNGDSYEISPPYHTSEYPWSLHTIDGVHGRDVRSR